MTVQRRQQYRERCGKCGARRIDRQIGLEPTVEQYVSDLCDVFDEVRRVMRDDATLWCNLGDAYGPGKQLLGVPWRVAFALQARGWYLRSDIIWSKPNPMPESVTDRPTKAHEYVFLLSKGPRYFYDVDAVREPQDTLGERHEGRSGYRDEHPSKNGGYATMERSLHPGGRNKRSVWTVAKQPYANAHFATYPPKLIEPCILAGAPESGVVLDPFAGAGTTGLVALQHGRDFIGIELNPDYAAMARERIETAVRLGFRSPQSGPEQIPGQVSIFDLNGTA